MRKQQVKKEVQTIHDTWVEAIKSTPGIGPIRYREIMKRREEIARRSMDGRRTTIPSK
jgi:hypothetical protein